MYWNISEHEKLQKIEAVEPKHTMYWNMYDSNNNVLYSSSRTETYDVLKSATRWAYYKGVLSRTETYDVLKFFTVFWSKL